MTRRAIAKRSARAARRGISVVVVLAILAVTLASSYAIMRSQFVSNRIQQNSNRHGLARQAAMIGLSVAMRSMEQSGWGGVNTTLTGTLNSQDSYSATFTAGDDSLTSASANYAEYPYRVTIVSTGTSVDPLNSQSKATHKVRAVVRLIPRKLNTAPSDLATIVNYTWYQTANDTFTFQIPLRVQGKVRVQGVVALTGDYSWSSSISDEYLDDLDRMRSNGYPDDRPFNGPLELSFTTNNGTVRNWLTNTVGVSLISNSATGMSAQWIFPGSIGTYRLYPGGPSYNVPSAPSTISTTLQANPTTNPAGLFYASGDVTLANGANLNGTLVGASHVTVTGNNVSLSPVDLMSLQGNSNKIRLPTVLASDDMIINDTGSPTIDGLVATFDKFNVKMSPKAKDLAMQGNVVARRFIAEGKTEFNYSSLGWNLVKMAFDSQDNGHGIRYFPAYLGALGNSPDPNVVFQPPADAVTYVWPTSGFTIYVADPSDGALRWELVDWRDLR
jgi:hypothetical protein